MVSDVGRSERTDTGDGEVRALLRALHRVLVGNFLETMTAGGSAAGAQTFLLTNDRSSSANQNQQIDVCFNSAYEKCSEEAPYNDIILVNMMNSLTGWGIILGNTDLQDVLIVNQLWNAAAADCLNRFVFNNVC